MRASRALIAVVLTMTVGCGEAAVQPSATPGSASSGASRTPPVAADPAKAGTTADPFAVPSGPRDDLTPIAPAPLRLDAWEAAIKAKGVAPPPAACAAFAKRAPVSPAPVDLAGAFATAGLRGDLAAQVDARLLALEPTFDKKEPGLVRALRADVLAVPCADVIVDPYLAAHRTLVSRASHVLVGLSLAAKLERTGAGRPALGATADKAQVKAFVNGPLKAWMIEQSTAIETLASGAAGLSGYGRGVAALAAGNADLRLVTVIREAPTPASWDPELKAVYQAALDEALEPRKNRGRDAALVGLADLGQAGALLETRVIGAHLALSSLYGGRRISALAPLMAPSPPAWMTDVPVATMLESVGPFWTDVFGLGTQAPSSIGRGTALSLRSFFASEPADKSDPKLLQVRSIYALTRFRLGQVYWRRVDFVEAAQAAKQGKTPEDRLVLALSLALAQGPNGAAEMMRAPSAAALNLNHTEALDALVAEGSPLAGWAAFDAAYLRFLSPPATSEAGPYYRDVAARFRKAATLLEEPARKQQAIQRAEEAEAIVTAIDQKPPTP